MLRPAFKFLCDAALVSQNSRQVLARSPSLVRAVAGLLAAEAHAAAPAVTLLGIIFTGGHPPPASIDAVLDAQQGLRAVVDLVSSGGKFSIPALFLIIMLVEACSGASQHALERVRQAFRRLPTMEGLAALIGHELDSSDGSAERHLWSALELAEALEPDTQRFMAFWMRPGAASGHALRAIMRLLRHAECKGVHVASRWIWTISDFTSRQPYPAQPLLRLQDVLLTPGLDEATATALTMSLNQERTARDTGILKNLSDFLATAVGSAPALVAAVPGLPRLLDRARAAGRIATPDPSPLLPSLLHPTQGRLGRQESVGAVQPQDRPLGYAAATACSTRAAATGRNNSGGSDPSPLTAAAPPASALMTAESGLPIQSPAMGASNPGTEQQAVAPDCCAGCAKAAGNGVRLKVCTGCRAAPFCSQECYKAAWKAGHRQECKAAQAAAAERDAQQQAQRGRV